MHVSHRLFLDFSRCFLIIFSVIPGHVFRKPCSIALRRLAVVGLKSDTCKYLASSVFDVCYRMLFTTFPDCCGPRGTSHIPFFLFLVFLNISYTLFWMYIACLSSLMVHPSSHNTHNNIDWAVCIFGRMFIYLTSLLRPGS